MNDTQHPSFDDEYGALREGRGCYELTGWSSISVTGADRQAFLHNFCTNDIKRLVPGARCEAFFTNVKGKVIGHGVVSCRGDELIIFGASGQAGRLIEHLDRYIIREDVQLADKSEAHKYVYVLSDAPATDVCIEWNIVGRPTGTIVEVPAGEAFSPGNYFGEAPFAIIHSEAFTVARIEAGFPLFGIDFNEENLPQEVGRDRQAISFTKGCYLGQETVARIDALGHVNQQLVGVRFSGAEVPSARTELSRASVKAGRVTSAAFSPQLGAPLAIAMVRRDTNTIGTRLESAFGECEVVAFPVAGSSS